jgi:hypothetical protein
LGGEVEVGEVEGEEGPGECIELYGEGGEEMYALSQKNENKKEQKMKIKNKKRHLRILSLSNEKLVGLGFTSCKIAEGYVDDEKESKRKATTKKKTKKTIRFCRHF